MQRRRLSEPCSQSQAFLETWGRSNTAAGFPEGPISYFESEQIGSGTTSPAIEWDRAAPIGVTRRGSKKFQPLWDLPAGWDASVGGISLNGVELNLSLARGDVNIKRLSTLQRVRSWRTREPGRAALRTYFVDKCARPTCMQYIK